jgi:hypothetical protein
VIEHHEGDAVSTADEFLTEEDLLTFGAPHVGHIFSP